MTNHTTDHAHCAAIGQCWSVRSCLSPAASACAASIAAANKRRPNPQTLTRFDADGARDPWANDPDRTTRREATS